MGTIIRFPVAAGAEPPVDPNWTIEAGLRSYIAVEEALTPWSDSNLISRLAHATSEEREIILAELEQRGPQVARKEYQ